MLILKSNIIIIEAAPGGRTSRCTAPGLASSRHSRGNPRAANKHES